MSSPQDVLDFWFGAPTSPEHGTTRGVWFKKSDAFDLQVRSRFLAIYESASAGALVAWDETPLSRLALIIVLDQFPRNMFRDQARAFRTDAAALAAAQRIVERNWDRQLTPRERWFAYMPFEHAEDLAQQERSVALFERLAADNGLVEPLAWAHKHYDVIARFGRFPHRNAILGRMSTPEEIEFLQEAGSSF